MMAVAPTPTAPGHTTTTTTTGHTATAKAQPWTPNTSTDTCGDGRQGRLLKWTNFLLGWQERLVHLTAEGALQYFVTEVERAEGRSRDALPLAQASVFEKGNCAFDVIAGAKTFSFKAASEDEAAAWVEAVRACVAQHKQTALQRALDSEAEAARAPTLEEQVTREDEWMVMPELSELTTGGNHRLGPDASPRDTTFQVEVQDVKGRASVTCMELADAAVCNTWSNTFTLRGLGHRHAQLAQLDSALAARLPTPPAPGLFKRGTLSAATVAGVEAYFSALLAHSDRAFVVDLFFNGGLELDDFLVSLGDFNRQEAETRQQEIRAQMERLFADRQAPGLSAEDLAESFQTEATLLGEHAAAREEYEQQMLRPLLAELALYQEHGEATDSASQHAEKESVVLELKEGWAADALAFAKTRLHELHSLEAAEHLDSLQQGLVREQLAALEREVLALRRAARNARIRHQTFRQKTVLAQLTDLDEQFDDSAKIGNGVDFVGLSSLDGEIARLEALYDAHTKEVSRLRKQKTEQELGRAKKAANRFGLGKSREYREKAAKDVKRLTARMSSLRVADREHDSFIGKREKHRARLSATKYEHEKPVLLRRAREEREQLARQETAGTRKVAIERIRARQTEDTVDEPQAEGAAGRRPASVDADSAQEAARSRIQAFKAKAAGSDSAAGEKPARSPAKPPRDEAGAKARSRIRAYRERSVAQQQKAEHETRRREAIKRDRFKQRMQEEKDRRQARNRLSLEHQKAGVPPPGRRSAAASRAAVVHWDDDAGDVDLGIDLEALPPPPAELLTDGPTAHTDAPPPETVVPRRKETLPLPPPPPSPACSAGPPPPPPPPVAPVVAAAGPPPPPPPPPPQAPPATPAATSAVTTAKPPQPGRGALLDSIRRSSGCSGLKRVDARPASPPKADTSGSSSLRSALMQRIRPAVLGSDQESEDEGRWDSDEEEE